MSFATRTKSGTTSPGVDVIQPAHSTESQDPRTLLVGNGISLQGSVTDAERLIVEGTVESKAIRATQLAVGRTGVFRGEAEVEHAEIAGLFDGSITVRGNLTIRATGTLQGAVRYRSLIVEDGGALVGSMEVLPKEA